MDKKYVWTILCLIVFSMLIHRMAIGAPTPITSISNCQNKINDSTSLQTRLTNYDTYGTKLSDGRYVLCFDASKTATFTIPVTLTGKPNKPLIIYGLTWSKTSLAPTTALLTVSGSNVLLQHVNLTANTTAVKIDGTSHGIVDSTLTGTNAAGSVGIQVSAGTNHGISANTKVSNFEKGIVVADGTSGITIADVTVTDTQYGIDLGGTKNAIGPKTTLIQSPGKVGKIGIKISGLENTLQDSAEHQILGATNTSSSPTGFTTLLQVGGKDHVVTDIMLNGSPGTSEESSAAIIADSIGLRLEGAGHHVENSLFTHIGTAVIVDGDHQQLEKNLLDGDTYDIHLLATATQTTMQGNKFEKITAKCPEGDGTISCHIHFDPKNNDAPYLQPSIAVDEIFKITGMNDGKEVVKQLFYFRPSSSLVSTYTTIQSVKIGNISFDVYGPIDSGVTLIESSPLLSQIKSLADTQGGVLDQTIPDAIQKPYGAVQNVKDIDGNNNIILQFHTTDGGSSGLTSLAPLSTVTSVFKPNTTPGFTPVIVGPGETGPGGGEVAMAGPTGGSTPSDADPAKDDKKSGGSQMAGGDGAAVIVGGGAAEGAPLSGLGAGVKGGCSLILPR